MSQYPPNYGYNQPPPPGMCPMPQQQQPYYPPPMVQQPAVCPQGPYYPQPQPQTIIHEKQKSGNCLRDCMLCTICMTLCCWCCTD